MVENNKEPEPTDETPEERPHDTAKGKGAVREKAEKLEETGK